VEILKKEKKKISGEKEQLMDKRGIAIQDDQREMGPYLIFVERDKSLARCIPKDQVETAIVWAHDSHGHFSAGLTINQLIARYFWPTRNIDVEKYCRHCMVCQYFRPEKLSIGMMPVINVRILSLIKRC
jgi:hypothetical protein